MKLEWPKFEVAVFCGLEDVPAEVRNGLLRAGVPKNSLGRLYRASEQPVSVEVPGYGRLIQFGSAGLSGGVYIDTATGQVVELTNLPGAVPQLINTTLGQFVATVRTVIETFPFYNRNAELEERTKVAARISAAIGGIDSAALAPDSFWGTFVDDVVTGDFATEDVVGASEA